MSSVNDEKKGTWAKVTIEGSNVTTPRLTQAELEHVRLVAETAGFGTNMATQPSREETVAICDELLTLRKDQADWRKGVELIASAAGYKDGLSCVDIAEAVLAQRAKLEQAIDALGDAATMAYRNDCRESAAKIQVKINELRSV